MSSPPRPQLQATPTAAAAADNSSSLNTSSSSIRPTTSTSCFPLLELPHAALAAVLRALDTQGVLRAGQACRQLHAAAVAALDKVHAPPGDELPGFDHWWRQRSVDSLLRYLGRHGQHVTHLCVGDAEDEQTYPHLAALPNACSLRELCLSGISAQLGPGNGSPGVLHAAQQAATMQAVTGLWLYEVQATDDAACDVAAALAQLTQLQHLELDALRAPGVLPSSMLARLQGLTELQLADPVGCLQDSSLEHISMLTALRTLGLESTLNINPPEPGEGEDEGVPVLSAAALSGLQQLQHLTELKLSGFRGIASLAALPRALEKLTLHGQGFGSLPGSVARATQLRDLDLQSWGRRAAVGDARETAALLQRVGGMAQLTALRLHRLLPVKAADPPSACACLTASSRLVDMACDLQAGAWQAMFGGGKSLPHLRALMLWPAPCQQATREAGAVDVMPGDLDALVRCCPALRGLSILSLRLHADVQLSVLTGFSQLTYLMIKAPGGDASARQLEQLPHLQSLYLSGRTITDAGLAHLTALTRLTFLSVTSQAFSPRMEEVAGGRLLIMCSRADPGRPDVAPRLRRLLARARA